MFYYFKYNDVMLFSLNEHPGFKSINENTAKEIEGTAYFLGHLNPLKSRDSFVVSDSSMFFMKEETVDFLNTSKDSPHILSWITKKLESNEIVYVNTAYNNWESLIGKPPKEKWNVNVIAVGDVGSTLLIGLNLLGKGVIDKIGIYDRTLNNQKRWESEMNQIVFPFDYEDYPEVEIITEKQICDCDMIIFCAAKGYNFDENTQDVRMVQFEKNAEIITQYSKLVRDANFKGIFAVVSDPVDLLCKKVLIESNTNENGTYDNNGLFPSQIIGYGLGVMNGRAIYHAKKNPAFASYITEGRAYGPHGAGLIIANSIDDYDASISNELTQLAYEANLEVRAFGYKPYVAPALSSGAISILATLRGDWNYSSTFLGGIFMGAKNRYINNAFELEQLDLPDVLVKKLRTTFSNLEDII